MNVALRVTRNLRSYHAHRLNYRQIINEIDNYRIIGVRIQWRSTSGHFVAIHGYDVSTGVEFISVGDPNSGKKAVRLDFFSNNYDNVSGTWSHTYLTQHTNTPGMIRYSVIDKDLLIRAERMLPTILRGGAAANRNIVNEGFNNKYSAHRAYVVPFQSIRNRNEHTEQVGLRLIDSYRNDMIIAEFGDRENELNLQQVFYETKYTKPYFERLKSIITTYRTSDQPYELSIVSQPELNVEAFWLHNLRLDNRDIFIIFWRDGNVTEPQTFSTERFYVLLRNLADNAPISEDDLLGN